MRFTFGAVGAAASAFTFASIGDWGGASVGGYRATNEKDVAAQLKKTAAEKGIQFVLNTGDNFYFCGVKSLDDAQFKTVFEDVYDDEALYVPWYGCFGNHDYAYDVKPQIQYKSPNKDRWQIPAPYYSKRIALSGSQHMTLIVLDTTPCYQDYINDDSSKWDPCSPEYASECTGPDGKCDFHENVLKADSCADQAKWLKAELAKVPKDDWVVAMGHNPSYQMDVEDLTSMLLGKPIHLYLNGHVHYLSQYKYSTHMAVDFVTTGAGCMVNSHDQEQADLFQVDEGKHSFEYNQKVSGFTLHTFSDDFSTLTTDFIGVDGSTLHSFVTRKDGSSPPAPAPGPGPAPPSPSPGAGTCAKFGCDYNPEHPCQCNYQCKAHEDCCSDYDKACGPPTPAPTPAASGSCAKYGCGKWAKTNTCNCNSYCKWHKDCCSDYDDVCKKEEEVSYV